MSATGPCRTCGSEGLTICTNACRWPDDEPSPWLVIVNSAADRHTDDLADRLDEMADMEFPPRVWRPVRAGRDGDRQKLRDAAAELRRLRTLLEAVTADGNGLLAEIERHIYNERHGITEYARLEGAVARVRRIAAAVEPLDGEGR